MSRKCLYCGEPHPVSAQVAEENPFCSACLPERIALKTQSIGKVEFVESNDYVTVMSLRPEMPGQVPS
jgi:hypothetical protein